MNISYYGIQGALSTFGYNVYVNASGTGLFELSMIIPIRILIPRIRRARALVIIMGLGVVINVSFHFVNDQIIQILLVCSLRILNRFTIGIYQIWMN